MTGHKKVILSRVQEWDKSWYNTTAQRDYSIIFMTVNGDL